MAAVGDFLAEEGAAEEVVDGDVEGGSGVGGLEGYGVVGGVGVEGDLGGGGGGGWRGGFWGEFEDPEFVTTVQNGSCCITIVGPSVARQYIAVIGGIGYCKAFITK